MSQQGLLQQSIRDITGTALDYNGDWLALMAEDSITTGSFNERLLAWINVTLGTSYTNLPEAQQAFAVDQGYTSWSHMGAIVLATAGAIELLGSETQGLALDFTDDYYQADTGHYGSAYVLDPGTPANNYDSHPYGLLTYTSPSAKMTLGPSGTLRFGAHNLYLNSASPANQSITVVSGATYSVDITGSVSATASGAATGTWTAGSNTFTAATTTLTLGSTSGTGTVVVRRTPSASTNLATAGTARYDLPLEWDANATLLHMLPEPARTNLALWCRDLTNAAYIKTNSGGTTLVTTAKTATGADGVSNSATTVTASVDNGFVRQNITSASAERVQSVWIKRRTGTGAVYLSQGLPSGSELITNGDFPTDTSGWTASNATIANVAGTLEVTATAAVAAGYQTLSGLTAGALYRITGSATRSDASSASARVAVYDTAPANTLIETCAQSTGSLSTGSVVFRAPSDGVVSIVCLLVGAVAGAKGVFDNVSVMAVTETAVTVTADWTRVETPEQTLANPIFTLRLATSGDAVDVDFVQQEVGEYATSPIWTYGSTVTRAVDWITLNTSLFPWGWPVTIFAELQGRANSAAVESDNVSIAAYIDGSGNYNAISGGTTGGTSIGAANTSPAYDKVAFRFATNDVRVCVNGTLSTADTSASEPASLGTSIWFGREIGGDVSLGRGIKRALIVPRAMLDAEMQALTS